MSANVTEPNEPTHVTTDCIAALNDEKIKCDVFVEATNSIIAAYDFCLAAIERKAHVVLMNAEVDLILGHLLQAADDGPVAKALFLLQLDDTLQPEEGRWIRRSALHQNIPS